MKPGSVVFTLDDFPAYLGYGALNPDSYTWSDGKASAEYIFQGLPILNVEQSEEGVNIEEVFQGTSLRIAQGLDLQRTISLFYGSGDPSKSPLHRAWIDELIHQGNIYAEYITKTNTRLIFYPAVYLMDIRVPVLDEDIKQVMAFIDTPALKKWQPKLIPSTLVTVYPDRTENLTISILLITAPIAFTIGVAKLLSQAGIIKREKRFRSIVSVVKPLIGTWLRTFHGTERDPWLAYAVTMNND